MKKNFISLLFLSLLLGSCSLSINPSSGGRPFDPSSESSQNSNNEQSGEFFKKYTNTLRDTNEQLGWHTLNSTGNQKVLVVPVKFSDGPAWTEEKLSNLNKIFFGQPGDTNWQSVKSFFEVSSYGKLNITGEVYNTVLNLDISVSNYNRFYLNNDTTYDPGTYIGNLFYNSMSSQKNVLKNYDQDGDGYLDAVIFCYSNAYNDYEDSAYWAWCYCTNNKSNTSAPTVNNYMWVSYDFMNDSYNGGNAPKGKDGHTFIHEMGHILGLDDYYCYDRYDLNYVNPWNSAGDLEMQADNVGDHNIYSKFSLGWVDPIHVTESQTVTLRSSALYGDAILINDDWNGTIFDEYLLIEYYTPEGNNAQDSKYAFGTRDKMYTDSGLRIYHVDARMVKINSFAGFAGYANTQKEMVDLLDSNYIGCIGASNSQGKSYLKSDKDKDRLLHLIDAGGNNTIKNGISGRNSYGSYVNRTSAIWKTGTKFEATSAYFMKGTDKFNDGSKIGYSISVGETVNGAITVTITKK